ncbi:MAG TPA: DUF1697 domain-containing protein [Acidimicrobiales bacterium]|nr:DUF1697 domain-containing protein [Acidimicrobiales bacterium]
MDYDIDTGMIGDGMARYAALLRGINVGPNKRIAMADLRALLAGLGFTDVETLLQSGNAVFAARKAEPDRLARRIEQAIDAQLGLDVRCLVRDSDELDGVIEGNPLGEVATNGSKLVAHFLSGTPDPKLVEAHDPRSLAPEEIRLGDRVIYQWCPDGILAAPAAGGFAEKYLDVTATARNWNTVTKLGALLGDKRRD